MREIVFDPSYNPQNKYIGIIKDMLLDSGVRIYSFGKVFRHPRLFLRIGYFHFNWFENIVASNPLQATFYFLRQVFKVFLLKLFQKKIVWTMHNMQPHKAKYLFYQKVLLRLIIKSAYKIVTHSRSSAAILKNNYQVSENKIAYLPHPNYINQYGEVKADKALLQDTRIHLLFVGLIKPYKNIELLIDVCRELPSDQFKFEVVGNCKDSIYLNDLKERSRDLDNFILTPKFIDDEEIPCYLASCDAVILPYNIQSSLNSGSAMLAFSYKKTVVIPKIGTVKDYESHIPFSYEYDGTAKDHFMQLKNVLMELQKFTSLEGKRQIAQYGLDIYHVIANETSNEKMKSILSKIYSDEN